MSGLGMIKQFVQKIIIADNAYGGIGMMLALYFVAMLIILFYCRDEKLKKSVFVPSIILIGFLYGIVPFLDVFVRSMEYYDGRFFWMLMTPVVTAAGLTLFVKGISDGKKQVVAILILMPIIFFCGKFSISDAMYKKAENSYRLPQAAVDITEYVLSKKENPLIIVPYTIAHPFRQITTDVRLLYGEDASEGRITTAPVGACRIASELEHRIPYLGWIMYEGREFDPDYIAFDTVYTELCEHGNINIYNYPPDKNYVGERESMWTYENVPYVTMAGTEEDPYWDLSSYGLIYEGRFGQYVLYSYDKENGVKWWGFNPDDYKYLYN